MSVHLEKQVQIEDKTQVRALIFDEAPIVILIEYSNNSDIFLAEYAAELSRYTGINDYAIELEKSKQPLFGPIYSLGSVNLEILKTYIETNLANGFICLFKFPVGVPIFWI